MENEFNFDFIHSIIEQAKDFLVEQGEFFPFGYLLDNELNARSVAVFFDDEFPSSLEVIQQLEQTLKNDLRSGKCLSVAVCSNITVTDEQNRKFDAIQIRLQNVQGLSVDLIIPYEKKGANYEYFKAQQSDGSLLLI